MATPNKSQKKPATITFGGLPIFNPFEPLGKNIFTPPTANAATVPAAQPMIGPQKPAAVSAPTTKPAASPTATPIKPAIPATTQTIQSVQSQIADVQAQIKRATEAGYGPGGQFAGQQIPANILTPPAPKPVETKAPEPTVAPELPPPAATDTITSFVTSLSADLEKTRKSLEDSYNKQIADLRARQAESQKRIDEFTAKEEEMLTGKVQELTTPFRADLEKTERERLKVEENFFENQQLTNELDSLLTEGNTIIQQMKGVTGLAGIRNPRMKQTLDDISARVGVISAVMAARNGQIAQATNLIDRSVAATTADRQDQLSYYNTLLNFYDKQRDEEGKKLITLEKDEKDFLSAKIGLLEGDMKRTQDTADYLKKLMINPETAQYAASAGVTLNDSVEQINTKLANYAQQKEVNDFKNGLVAKGYEFVPFPQPGRDYATFTVGGQVLSFKKPPVELKFVDGKAYNPITGELVGGGTPAPTTTPQQEAAKSDVDRLSDAIRTNPFKFTEKENAALGVLLALDTMAKNNPDGKFEGISPIRMPAIFQSAEGIANRQFLEAINLTTQTWASGAALTAEQTKQVQRLTPDANDTDRQVREKINGLASYMLQQIKGAAIKSGIQLPVNQIKYTFSDISNAEVEDMDNILNQ